MGQVTRRWWARTVAVVLGVGMVAFTAVASAATSQIRIGFVAAITGPASSLGVPERDVAVQLEKDWNAQGGLPMADGARHPVKIMIVDDQSKSDETVKAAKKLIADDQVHVLIATSQTPDSLAVIPIVNEAKAPHISMASSHAIVTPVKDRHWTFKTPQSNIHMAVHWVKYLKAKGIKKVASLYVNNGFGEDSRRGLAENLKGTDIELVYEDKFEATDKDMTPQLTKVKASGAGALLAHAIPPGASILTKNFKDLGLTIPLIHNHGAGNKPFITLAGGAAEGLFFPSGKVLVAESLPDSDPQKKALLEFIAWYEKGLGKPRSTFAGHAWDALQLTRLALVKVRPTGNLAMERAAIRDSLEGVKNFAGTGGIFTMSPEDHVGLDNRAMVFVRIVKDNWEYFGPEKW